MNETRQIVVGDNAETDAESFVDAWERAEQGEQFASSRVLAFESWEALAAVLTGERFRLFRHLRGRLATPGLASDQIWQYISPAPPDVSRPEPMREIVHSYNVSHSMIWRLAV